MVRVNLIPPSMLVDEHLRAEYVELQMLVTFITKHPIKGRNDPEEYTLGKGHMSFFRDKGWFIFGRFIEVYTDCKRRGFNINVEHYENTIDELLSLPMVQWQDYEPTKEAIALNVDRIVSRLRNPVKKKSLWKYKGEDINDIEEFISVTYDDE